LESHDHVKGHLVQSGAEVGSARGSRAVFGGLAENHLSANTTCSSMWIRSRSTSRRTVHASGVRSPSKRRQRAVDPRHDFLLTQHFEQMIKARSHITTSRREPRRVNDCANFYSELCRGSL